MQDNVLLLTKDSFLKSNDIEKMINGELSYQDLDYYYFNIDRTDWNYSNIVMLSINGNTYILRNRYGSEGVVTDSDNKATLIRSRNEIIELRRKFRDSKDILLLSGGITKTEIKSVEELLSWVLCE